MIDGAVPADTRHALGKAVGEGGLGNGRSQSPPPMICRRLDTNFRCASAYAVRQAPADNLFAVQRAKAKAMRQEISLVLPANAYRIGNGGRQAFALLLQQSLVQAGYCVAIGQRARCGWRRVTNIMMMQFYQRRLAPILHQIGQGLLPDVAVEVDADLCVIGVDAISGKQGVI